MIEVTVEVTAIQQGETVWTHYLTNVHDHQRWRSCTRLVYARAHFTFNYIFTPFCREGIIRGSMSCRMKREYKIELGESRQIITPWEMYENRVGKAAGDELFEHQ